MKNFLWIIFLLSFLNSRVYALDTLPLSLQLKYSPLGSIFADEDEFEADYYQKFDMDFARSYGAKLFLEPFYIAVQHSVTDIDNDIPDATVNSISLGLGGVAFDQYASGNYLLGSLGAGRAEFKFKNPSLNDEELFVEASAEVGFHFEQKIFLGLGVDWHHFGRPTESKANLWSLYVGVSFRL